MEYLGATVLSSKGSLMPKYHSDLHYCKFCYLYIRDFKKELSYLSSRLTAFSCFHHHMHWCYTVILSIFSSLQEECFSVLERDQLLIIRTTLHCKGSSVMGMVRTLIIVDLEVEQKYLIFFLHLGE
jgi:hypothetical protein